jgi:hypothetical protein
VPVLADLCGQVNKSYKSNFCAEKFWEKGELQNYSEFCNTLFSPPQLPPHIGNITDNYFSDSEIFSSRALPRSILFTYSDIQQFAGIVYSIL